MNDSSDWELLLDRYLAGECSPAEEMRVVGHLNESGELREAVEALRAARARSAPDPAQLPPSVTSPEETRSAFQRLETRLAQRGVAPNPGPRLVREVLPEVIAPRAVRSARQRTAWTSPGWGIWAATVAAACGVAMLTSWIALRATSRESRAARPAYRDYATARGERAEVRLPDGTRVTLNVDSRLRVAATYGTTSRDVDLVGEAYFTVVHDATRPFAVRTGHGVTRDVGTSFDVRAYRDTPVDRIVVVEGQVAIGHSLLTAGDLADATDSANVHVTHGVNLERSTAWTRGRLEFADEPFGAALAQLGRWYDLDVQLEDTALARLRISGSYSDESLTQVLSLVTAAAGAQYERRGQTVIVRAVR